MTMLLPLLFFQASSVFTVGGVVVNGTTNAPLNKTSVLLISHADETTNKRTVVTGPDGRFRFDGVAKGKYALAAERNGFVSQFYKQRSLYQPYASAIVTVENERTENIVFQLIPEGTITGYVKDLQGEPVRGMQVLAYRIAGPAGQKQAWTAPNGFTDDRGYYRIHSLAAGTYALVVSPSTWRSEEAQESNRGAFPVTFFPGTTEAEHAGTLRVEAGHEAKAEVLVDPVPCGRVKGTVAPLDNLNGSLSVTLTAKGPFGAQFRVGDEVAVFDSKFTIEDVPIGHYELSLWDDHTHLRPAHGRSDQSRPGGRDR